MVVVSVRISPVRPVSSFMTTSRCEQKKRSYVVSCLSPDSSKCSSSSSSSRVVSRSATSPGIRPLVASSAHIEFSPSRFRKSFSVGAFSMALRWYTATMTVPSPPRATRRVALLCMTRWTSFSDTTRATVRPSIFWSITFAMAAKSLSPIEVEATSSTETHVDASAASTSALDKMSFSRASTTLSIS